jgi:hypothetical protein
VAFVGSSTTGPRGIYLYENGNIEKVINSVDFIDGKDVSNVALYPSGLYSGGLAFRVSFADGSSGVYVAEPEPTTGIQTVDLDPTFDVQLIPGDVFTLEEGAIALTIRGTGVTVPAEDVLMEFPLGNIPAGSEIVSATLSLDGSSSSGTVQVVVDGYTGDGLASTADVNEFLTTLATSDPYSASSNIEINLDTTFIESILGASSHLGLRLSSLLGGSSLSVLATEATFGDAPTLSIEFEAPTVSGDFDSDEDVDGPDFLAWQQGGSPTPNSSSDLQDWTNGYGAQPGAVARSTAIPEPASAVSLACAAMALALSDRRATKARTRLRS